MLSQRIAGMAAELALMTEKDTRSDLRQQMSVAVDLLEESHHRLSSGLTPAGASIPMSAAVTAIYRREPYSLDARVNTFVALARAYLASPASWQTTDPSLHQLLDSAHEPLLRSLDAVVTQHQGESEASIHLIRRILIGIVATILATLIAISRYVFRPMLADLRKAHAAMVDMALTDPLTGCKNRRFFMEVGEHEIERSRRSATPLAVALLDIDRFKSINDSLGHAVGDVAIKALVGIALKTIRASDVMGRIGGEEFAVLLPDTTLEAAMVAAEKLREQIAAAVVETPEIALTITASIGVTVLADTDDGITAALDRADQALYQAKQTGRNRVICRLPGEE